MRNGYYKLKTLKINTKTFFLLVDQREKFMEAPMNTGQT